jgi:hypothetical protein
MKEDPDALTDKSDLCRMFPDIDTDMLHAVLTANGNSLEKAIEDINAHMQCALGKRPQTVSSPEALVKRGRYLLDQASEEQLKMDQMNRVCFVYTSLCAFGFHCTLHLYSCELKINTHIF